MCTSAHQPHGKNAHARLLVHLVLLECDTVALRACLPSGLVRPDLVGARLGLGIRSIVGHCGAGVAEKIQSCLMENASRNLKQAREECTHDDGGVEPGRTSPSRRSRHEKDVPTMMEVVGPGQTCR
jgi:hypothetical protein